MTTPTIHLANTSFEIELSSRSSQSLLSLQRVSPVSHQLQYLPLLYAAAEDIVVVSELPDTCFLDQLAHNAWWRRGQPLARLERLDSRNIQGSLLPWGWSPSVQAWAKDRSLQTPATTIDVLTQVNSKLFSFHHSPRLFGAFLAYNELDLMKAPSYPYVIKTAFGLSGRGNLIVRSSTQDTIKFCQREWQMNRPVIVEPWVERLLDFSTQWDIYADQAPQLHALSLLENSYSGTYQKSIVGPMEVIQAKVGEFWEAHVNACRTVLERMASLGYMGPVGIDAMIYRWQGRMQLHPIVEINARQTMTRVAHHIWIQMGIGRCLEVGFIKDSQAPALLPRTLPTCQRPFQHQLIYNDSR